MVLGQESATPIRDPHLPRQLGAIGTTAAIIGGLGLVPGMPHLVFLFIAGALAALAWAVHRRRQAPPTPMPAAAAEVGEAMDTLGLEVGYRLVALVDKSRNGELLGRIKGVRKKFAQDVGFLPPAVHIRDNLVDLKPGKYRVLLRGAVIGEGEAYPGMDVRAALLWTQSGELVTIPHDLLVTASLDGTDTRA